MAMDEHDLQPEASEPSEATQIVDAELVREVRAKLALSQVSAYVVVIAGPHTGKNFKVDADVMVMGRSPKAQVQLQDVGVSRNHAQLKKIGDKVYVEDMNSANGTFLNGEPVRISQELKDGDKITLGSTTVLKFTYHDKLDEDFQKHMFDAAVRDGMTLAYNKSFFTQHLHNEFAFATRHRQPLCLLLFDVDHFKRVNDTYGHQAGDAVLVKLASLAGRALRAEDVLARVGGEEFAVVCRGINGQQGLALAERIRDLVARAQFVHEGVQIPVTISIGVASVPEVDVLTSEQLISVADAALYRAKNNGRNRCELGR